MSIASAFDAFLPYPVYRFVGGPFDGQSLKVRMIDLGEERGLMAPERWRIQEASKPDFKKRVIRNQVAAPVHEYEFKRSDVRYRNQGWYQYVGVAR